VVRVVYCVFLRWNWCGDGRERCVNVLNSVWFVADGEGSVGWNVIACVDYG
jgi:hypothetical protein